MKSCRLIATLGAGDALGEMALLKQGGLRTATVQAITDCEVLQSSDDICNTNCMSLITMSANCGIVVVNVNDHAMCT